MNRHNNHTLAKTMLLATIAVVGFAALALVIFLALDSKNRSLSKESADMRQGAVEPNQAVSPNAHELRLELRMPSENEPKLQGKPAGEVLTPLRLGKDLRASILAYPAPKVWLEFPKPEEQSSQSPAQEGTSSSVVKVQLPQSARRVLEGLWREACASMYDVLTTQNIDTKKNLTTAQSIANNNAAYALQRIIIKAPNGSRKISSEEATGLVRYLGESAEDFVKQAVEARKQKLNAV